MSGRLQIAVLVASLVLASGCTSQEKTPDSESEDAEGTSNPCQVQQDPQGQKVVCTGKNFSYTLQGSRSAATDSYAWQNPERKGFVGAVFQGSGRVYIQIKDADGTQLYSKEHAGSGQGVSNDPTAEGTPGAWTVKIETKTLQGQVVVSVKRTSGSSSPS